jgi:DNA-3-methyladenine glycosylase
MPLEGAEAMRERRNGAETRRLADGPGKLCQALGITRELDGKVMRRSDVLVGRIRPTSGIVVTPRIGISKAVDWPLRFVLPSLSA